MEPLVLTDPNIQPTDELIFSIIGENSIYWQQLIDYLYDHHSDISEQWRFYNDGKCWLYRTLRKKKTIYWVGVQKDTFRVSVYIPEKAEQLIEASDLSERVKEEYRNAERSSFGRAITVIMHSSEDFDTVVKLAELRLKIK